MSSSDRTSDLLKQVAFASDGLVPGLAVAYLAVQTWRKYIFTSSLLTKVQHAPSVGAKSVGLLNEERILPVGKEVTALGACYLNDGILHIKSFQDLPYFLCKGFLAIRSRTRGNGKIGGSRDNAIYQEMPQHQIKLWKTWEKYKMDNYAVNCLMTRRRRSAFVPLWAYVRLLSSLRPHS
ncbi:hypothetical protein Sjap_003116 [Stephania japonica]|uniref:RING-type E3 ubiquitin transferase n=1 Tax=Stephania japonica TaxID=461633 RepID=A0AAP0PWS2_9MAGN